jgi:hypothetical protein
LPSRPRSISSVAERASKNCLLNSLCTGFIPDPRTNPAGCSGTVHRPAWYSINPMCITWFEALFAYVDVNIWLSAALRGRHIR